MFFKQGRSDHVMMGRKPKLSTEEYGVYILKSDKAEESKGY